MRTRGKIAVALAAMLGVPALTVGSWLMLRDPGQRAVDYIRLTRYWSAGFRSIADLPKTFEPHAVRVGIIRHSPVAVTVEPGVVMRLQGDDLIHRHLIERSTWENEEWEWVRANLRPGGTFVDVGAHHGSYSLKAAKIVGPDGKVIAIEPNPPTILRLKDNINLSGAKNIIVEEVACGPKRGTMTLFTGPSRNTGIASLSAKNAARRPDDRPNAVEVTVVPLDEVLAANPGRVDVIKIDAEGAETMILRGAAAILAKQRPALVLEVVGTQLQNLGSSVQELEDLLTSHGYRKIAQTTMNALWKPR